MVDLGFLLRKTVSIPNGCRERYAALDAPECAAWAAAGIEFAGISDLVPGYRICNPQPERVMVIATVSGSGWLVTPRGECQLTAGSLSASQPGQPVGWGIAGDSWRIAWWYFRPSRRWEQWQEAAPAALLFDLFADLLDRRGALAEDTAGLILRHLSALASPAAPADGFAELWREVVRHPSEDWSLPALARRLGVSVSTAQRLAQAHLGTSPHVALVEARLTQAQELLRRTNYPMQTVAELTGYADAFTFSAAYRRWAGHPPTSERRAQKE